MLRPYYSDDRRVKRVRAKVTARLIPSRVSRPARETATFISAVLLNRSCTKVFAPANRDSQTGTAQTVIIPFGGLSDTSRVTMPGC